MNINKDKNINLNLNIKIKYRYKYSLALPFFGQVSCEVPFNDYIVIIISCLSEMWRPICLNLLSQNHYF